MVLRKISNAVNRLANWAGEKRRPAYEKKLTRATEIYEEAVVRGNTEKYSREEIEQATRIVEQARKKPQ
ncbi:MAG: hypothetical protein CL944_03000 [Candidatus Diapherotrites archaeon]|uniref:Uncharacterized protein n=1 Tax=Candidatus Iainarchaeum sp. TaxID=3101447 RepID=A0A2D6LQF9_9ARCH|nr:hypothetical protein [Candidatus Diapherotrites archaeon]|tara:strand:+ start:29 stop:235 length:207 start_codon:yes stop_codon:yes gene_type:complete